MAQSPLVRWRNARLWVLHLNPKASKILPICRTACPLRYHLVTAKEQRMNFACACRGLARCAHANAASDLARAALENSTNGEKKG
jgi:hypothetical protein